MREVTPEALEAMIPKDATSLFFVYKCHYDRTRWVAYVVAEMINLESKERRAIIWFAKGVSDSVAQQMMQEIGERIEADTVGASCARDSSVGGNSDSRPSDANKENVRIYFDVCANVDKSWIRKAEKIFRDKKRVSKTQ